MGEKIRAARAAAGFTQFELALELREYDRRLAKTYDKTVGEWERDKTPRLPFYAVSAIARATGQSISFFGGEAELRAWDEQARELRREGHSWEVIRDLVVGLSNVRAQEESAAAERAADGAALVPVDPTEPPAAAGSSETSARPEAPHRALPRGSRAVVAPIVPGAGDRDAPQRLDDGQDVVEEASEVGEHRGEDPPRRPRRGPGPA